MMQLSPDTTDINGNEDKDILSASFIDNTVSWHKNTDGLGTFGPQQNTTTLAEGARDVFTTDIDNDALSLSSTDDKLAWYENLLF